MTPGHGRVGEGRERLRVCDQDDGGDHRDDELEHDPVVPEEPPTRSEGLHDAGRERQGGQRQQSRPCDHLRRDVRRAPDVDIVARETSHSERDNGGDRSQPPDRARDVSREHRFASARARGSCRRGGHTGVDVTTRPVIAAGEQQDNENGSEDQHRDDREPDPPRRAVALDRVGIAARRREDRHSATLRDILSTCKT